MSRKLKIPKVFGAELHLRNGENEMIDSGVTYLRSGRPLVRVEPKTAVKRGMYHFNSKTGAYTFSKYDKNIVILYLCLGVSDKQINK
jgi:hypothetical protein